MYALCGRSSRSSLRVLRHGLEVSEMAVSELPGNPNAVWTVRKRADGNLKFVCSSGVSLCGAHVSDWWLDHSSNASLFTDFRLALIFPGT